MMAHLGGPKLRMSSTVNVVFDGNSLTVGVGSTSAPNRYPDQALAMAPLLGSGVSSSSVGVSGQTWRHMDGLDGQSSADVDAAWTSGKTNILVCWETTNSVCAGGRTGKQAAFDAADYIANRKAANDWKVMVLTSIPRNGNSAGTAWLNQGERDAYNAELASADEYMRANYRAIGADVLCDLRAPGSPFAFANYLPASWSATREVWYEAAGTEIHITNAGYKWVAEMVAGAIRRVPGA